EPLQLLDRSPLSQPELEDLRRLPLEEVGAQGLAKGGGEKGPRVRRRLGKEALVREGLLSEDALAEGVDGADLGGVEGPEGGVEVPLRHLVEDPARLVGARLLHVPPLGAPAEREG